MLDFKQLIQKLVMMGILFQGTDVLQPVLLNLAGHVQIHRMFKVHAMKILFVETEDLMVLQENFVTMEIHSRVTAVQQLAQ